MPVQRNKNSAIRKRPAANTRNRSGNKTKATSKTSSPAKSAAARRRTRTKSNQSHQGGILGFFTAASSRAHQRTNQRNYRSRKLKSINASIAEKADEEYSLPTIQLIFRTLVAITLIFPCFISTVALFEINTVYAETHNVWEQLLQSREFLFFAVGSVLMLGWFFTQLFWQHFLFFYVLGHELTHAFFICLCGGKVSGFKVTRKGGYVLTNKTNILIALSPYFVPFWSCVVLAISYLVRLFIDIPGHDEILYFMIGFTWTFHLAWTLWMIPRDQPDLKENGSFFSLTIIYLANILLLALLLCLSPSGITFKAYCYQWINLCIENGLDLIGFFKNL